MRAVLLIAGPDEVRMLGPNQTIGWCQTKSNQSQLGQAGYPLSCAKSAPLGQSSGAVLLEEVSGGETAFLVEMV